MSRSIDQELAALLHCMRCQSERLRVETDALVCDACGYRPALDEHGILCEPSVESPAPVSERELRTKARYQSSEYALWYMQNYARPRGPSAAYAALVAALERRAVAQALQSVSSGLALVLDLPAGTGKLAPVHERFGYRVVAADASVDMLRTGLGVWQKAGQLAGMMQTDVRRTGFRSSSIDCTVCLRLMHRLPADIAHEGLHELARITKRWLIVSTRINAKTISSLRRAPRAHGVAPLDLAEWHRRVAEVGTLRRTAFVARGLSQEVVSLIDVSRPTTAQAPHRAVA